MACRSLAGPDNVLSPRLQVELGVECDYTVHLTDRDVDLLADLDQDIFREIPENLLSLLQHRYNAALSAAVLVQMLVQLLP